MMERFYTFYDFSFNRGYPPFRVLVQSQLKSRIGNLNELSGKWSDADFIRYFRQIVLDDSQSKSEKHLAHWHLVACIDKSRCYFIWKEYNSLPFYAAKSENFYGLTNEVLFNPEKFKNYLHKYDPKHESRASFTTYILGVLKNTIREKIDKLESDWHLLCNVDTSNTRRMNNVANKLREALKKYGIVEPHISQYVFAWQYFVPIYKNNNLYSSESALNTSRWKNPENYDFVETADYYNLQKNRPNSPLQVSSSLIATPKLIQEWMETCIKALRQDKNITEISRDNENYDEGREIDIFFTSNIEDDDLLAEVERVLREEIRKIEVKLPPIHRQVSLQAPEVMMLLSYAPHLAIFNQQQLADWLKINQGTISRYISNQIQKPLLNKFQNILTNKFDIGSYIDIFLEKRFTNPNKSNLDRLLSESFFELEDKQKKILKLLYGEKQTLLEVRVLLKDSSLDLERIQEIKLKLQNIFQAKINKWQKSYLKLWLQKYYEARVREVLLTGFRQLDSLQQELIQKRYCDKLENVEISKLYPEVKVNLTLKEATEGLKDFLLEWFSRNFKIELPAEDKQVIEIIESWLSRELIYLEI